MKGVTCTGPECDRMQMDNFDLCIVHRIQQREGIELRPIKKPGGQKQHKLCTFKDCNRPHISRGLCSGHNWQHKQGYELWPIGENHREEREPVKKGYSETMTCAYCKKTKNWALFIMGADTKKSQCKDCYHDLVISPPKEEKKQPVTSEQLIKAIFG